MGSFDDREERLQLHYERRSNALFRHEPARATIDSAEKLARDPRLAQVSIDFMLERYGDYVPGRWVVAEGLGAAFEQYVTCLSEMEKVRFGSSVTKGLTAMHHRAFEAVVDAGAKLASLGWPVNWMQNVQKILEPTEFGLRDGKLVDRFENLPDATTLGDELLLLGSVTYYEQTRSREGVIGRFRAKVFSPQNHSFAEDTQLHRANADEKLPARSRYLSDWIQGRAGTSYRIAA